MSNIFLGISKFKRLLYIISLLLYIKPISTYCSYGGSITDTICFNNLITIQKSYRVAQFATDKNGNMIIEYSNDKSGSHEYRLFYGLKKNGRNYFENNNAHKIIKIETDEAAKGRYESRILFILIRINNIYLALVLITP